MWPTKSSLSQQKQGDLSLQVDGSVLLLLLLGLLVFQLDRMNLASALTGGFAADIGVNQDTINLGNQLMFMGIVVLEIPCNMALQRLGPRKWISAQVFVFGLVATLQVLIVNRGGFLAARLMLGFAEAGYIPGAVYTLSTWYTKRELAKRVAVLFFGMFGGNALSPVLSSGILKLDSVRGFRGWQWLFLLEGIFTVIVSFLLLLFLPGSPDTPKPLVGPGIIRFSKDDQRTLQARLEKDDNLGFDRTEANALAAVGGFIALAVVFTFAYLSDRTNRRGGTVIAAQCCYLVTLIVARQVHPHVGKWSRWGLWTAVNSFAVGYHPVHNSWVQLNCREAGERSIAIAIWVMSAISGLMVGTQYFRPEDTPFYQTGLRTMIIMVSLVWDIFAPPVRKLSEVSAAIHAYTYAGPTLDPPIPEPSGHGQINRLTPSAPLDHAQNLIAFCSSIITTLEISSGAGRKCPEHRHLWLPAARGTPQRQPDGRTGAYVARGNKSPKRSGCDRLAVNYRGNSLEMKQQAPFSDGSVAGARRGRKPHRKSRDGCVSCKRRKVKCDEEKPSCANCVRFGIPCSFVPLPSQDLSLRGASGDNAVPPSVPRRGPGRPRKDWAALAGPLMQAMEKFEISRPSPTPLEPQICSLNVTDAELLIHYTYQTAATLAGSDDAQSSIAVFWARNVPQMGLSYHFVFNFAYSLAGYHLAYSHPTGSDSYTHYRSIARFYAETGLTQLNKIHPSVNESNCGALYVAAMLMCYCAVADGPMGTDDLLVCNVGDAAAPFWLPRIQGVRLIRQMIEPATLFTGLTAPLGLPGGNDLGQRPVDLMNCIIHRDWMEPLNKLRTWIASHASPDTVIYVQALASLSAVYEANCGDSNATRNPSLSDSHVLGWLYRLQDVFVARIQRKEPNALLMAGQNISSPQYGEC
ncbi:hypothetical protein G7Z17_g192 [Cylindrodendrum hubeiense]|uniref:Zn(2)-C6 fungal-type domain-containing protein n=1 Tax=Cylindrodendrum hubeiense TaxID=595255 RepID=A0A9P5HQK8_9HYPO|nr:hypothetical protein G7Z17_g192 [Cylindrodendrum hubeiense]